MIRYFVVLLTLVLAACSQTGPSSRVPSVPLMERPASLDAATEAETKASVLAALTDESSAEFSNLRIVDYVDLQGRNRWTVCGTVEVTGGESAGTQTFAYAPHTKIVRFGSGATRPQEACAGQP